jgi:PKD repeat protein
MKLNRLVTVTSALMGIVLAVGASSTSASAAPNKIGPVANLSLTAGAAAGGGYTVTSSWTPLAGATAYKITLTSGGATVASVTQTSPPWSATLALTPNTQIQVSVQPLEGKKPGIAASAVYTLPDLAPPVGAFTVTTAQGTRDATITQTSLSDDSTPASQIKRTVSWGDGSAAQPWQTGDTVSHNYAAIGRYVPTVTLTDNAGNTVTLTLKAAVFGDSLAPAANFASGPSSAFAKWTKVNLNVESLSDNYTPFEFIERTVSWGDGTTEAWKEGSTLTHVYAVAGTFTPSVVALDEAGNSSKTAADPITVTVDADGPAVTIAKPKAAAKVASWRTVRGKARDAGVGTASVALAAIQKRGDTWFAYSATTKKWAKAGTKGKAWKKAVAVAGTLDKSAWKARLTGLRKGKLLLRATAKDNVGNASRLVARAAKLTS